MKIGIDIDDTITDTYDVMFNYAQRYTINELKKDATPAKVDCLNHYYVENLHKWDKEESDVFWNKYYLEMIEKVKPKTFSVEYIKELSKNNEIYLITARYDDETKIAERITKKWLEKYDVPYKELVFYAVDKLKAAKENEIDIFIDDGFSNCKNLAEGGIKTFMMESAVNKNLDLTNEKFERVYSWPHLYQKIKLK